MKYAASLVLGFVLASCGAPNATRARPPSPGASRAKLIQCPSHSLGAGVELSPDGTHYTGFARDNYQNARDMPCTETPREIRCEGEWSFRGGPAGLVIRTEPDGKRVGLILVHGHPLRPLECVADQYLDGNCVFNPGTPTCTQPPWDKRSE